MPGFNHAGKSRIEMVCLGFRPDQLGREPIKMYGEMEYSQMFFRMGKGNVAPSCIRFMLWIRCFAQR